MLVQQLVIEDDPTPLAMAIAADLRRRLRDPVFAGLTADTQGSLGIRVGAGPEAVTVGIGDALTVRHGLESADVVITLDARHRWDGGSMEGSDDHADLARWAEALMSPPPADWRDAAARLWTELEPASGAPAALLVTELDEGEQLRLGEGARPYEIAAGADALVDLLEGRTALMEEASTGAVRIRGTFPEISVITGAMWRVRVGGWDDDG